MAECVSRDRLIRLSTSKSFDGDSANELANACGHELFFKHFTAALALAGNLKIQHSKAMKQDFDREHMQPYGNFVPLYALFHSDISVYMR